jgi:hypothetical protein
MATSYSRFIHPNAGAQSGVCGNGVERPSLEADRIAPLRSHIVVGDRRLALGSGENVRALLDHLPRIVRRSDGIEHSAIVGMIRLELPFAIDDIGFQHLVPVLEIPIDRRVRGRRPD